MGPMARADLRDSLHKQVEGSIAAGARVLCGGRPREGAGAFYMPTVLSGVTQGRPAFDDETFGPVAAVTASRMPMPPLMKRTGQSILGLLTVLDRLPAELQQRPYARMNLSVRREQFTKITHLVQSLLVVLHTCLHQQSQRHGSSSAPSAAGTAGCGGDPGTPRASCGTPAGNRNPTRSAILLASIWSFFFLAAAIARSING